MPKQIFLCKNCIDKYKVNNTIDSAMEQQRHRLKNLPNFAEKMQEVNQEMQAVQDKWLKRIPAGTGEETIMACGDCKKSQSITGGTVINDWHGFIDEIDRCLLEARKVGKESGRNIIPMTKYLAIKFALKAARML